MAERSGRCNLVLVSRPDVNDVSDFHRLAEYVKEVDRGIRPMVVFDRKMGSLDFVRRWRLRGERTLTFSPVRMDHFRPPGGVVLEGQALSKSEELEALEQIGVAAPPWERITQDRRPHLAHLGEYIVVKPDRGGRGAYVKIMRHSRVRWEPLETRVSGKSDAMVAQKFIYTGPWPVSYRVTTLFGEALWSYRAEANRDRRPLDASGDFRKVGGASVVSTGRGCVMALSNDEEVIRFAEGAHRAFPNHPLLGIDVIRELPSGKLYVLEVNSSGYTWHFSSPLGKEFQKEFGFSLEGQFDGIRKAARVLARVVRERVG